MHFVTLGDLAAVQYAGKHALAGHDAVAHALENLAAVVALFADLGDLEQYLTAAQTSADRQTGKIKAVDQQVFTECAVLDRRPPCVERLYFIVRQQAHLTVPVACMCVTLHAVIDAQGRLVNIFFLCAACRTGTDGNDLSHIILQFHSSCGRRYRAD